jgi:riboflavin kinase/FMN adenylyltransferase
LSQYLLIMIVHHGYQNLSFINPVVTLGIFDGVHLGHKSLIDSLLKNAKDLNGESVIVTFSPHPRLVLSGNKSELEFLTTPEEKVSLLQDYGVDHLIVIPFDHDLSNKEACQFIEEVLVRKIGSRCLVAGFNNLFGRRGDSDFTSIRRCAEAFNIKVVHVDALEMKDGIVSSTLIREKLVNGLTEKANILLGYNYSISGSVVEGKKLGRKLGYPTANIDPDNKHKLIPKNGVYAVEVMVDGVRYSGMLNIGTNPTVNDNYLLRTLEVNIFDFSRDIYKSEITLIFRYRLRDEIKFSNLSLLIKQLELDKQNALNLLKR